MHFQSDHLLRVAIPMQASPLASLSLSTSLSPSRQTPLRTTFTLWWARTLMMWCWTTTRTSFWRCMPLGELVMAVQHFTEEQAHNRRNQADQIHAEGRQQEALGQLRSYIAAAHRELQHLMHFFSMHDFTCLSCGAPALCGFWPNPGGFYRMHSSSMAAPNRLPRRLHIICCQQGSPSPVLQKLAQAKPPGAVLCSLLLPVFVHKDTASTRSCTPMTRVPLMSTLM